jgi:hypothetical protein
VIDMDWQGRFHSMVGWTLLTWLLIRKDAVVSDSFPPKRQ